MPSDVGYCKLFGVTTSLWVFFAFTTFFNLSWAAPNGLSRRAGEAPGLGVEFELGRINIEGKRRLTDDEKERIKGSKMTPIDFKGEEKTNWELTVEIASGDQRYLIPEAIIDGTKNKVGDGKTKEITEQIHNFFVEWEPCREKESKVKIEGFDDLGPWIVKWPQQAIDFDKVLYNVQATAAMPLGAIQEILSNMKNKKSNPLGSEREAAGIKLVTKDEFTSFSKIKPDDITEEFLGFFSLLTSYCSLSYTGRESEGPKQILSIMPRTDFVAQYKTFIEPKLKDQFADGQTSLKDIVETISGEGPALGNKKFKWRASSPTVTISQDWSGKTQDIQTATLEVGKFLNYLQGYDKATKASLDQMDLVALMDKTKRHGQIGGLGNKMEKQLGRDNLVPIFEFRDLNKVEGEQLDDTAGSYEDKVIELHRKYT